MSTLFDSGLGRMAIIGRFGNKQTPEWKQFCKTLDHTTDFFLMATLLRAVFDMVTDSETYRNFHCNQLYLVNHMLTKDALIAFRGSVLSRQTWLIKRFGKKVSKDEYQFASTPAKLLYGACRRTIDAIDQQLETMRLHDLFVGKTYTLIGPHNGHPDGTEVVCISALSDLALTVRPTKRTDNNSGFQMNLNDLKAVVTSSVSF